MDEALRRDESAAELQRQTAEGASPHLQKRVACMRGRFRGRCLLAWKRCGNTAEVKFSLVLARSSLMVCSATSPCSDIASSKLAVQLQHFKETAQVKGRGLPTCRGRRSNYGVHYLETLLERRLESPELCFEPNTADTCEFSI